uniref:Uncharacterized protein n=1 Tax=Amphimedon queenslandica TaxID=400682 RepID=A0A1X7V4A0_AMPQE
MSRDVKIATNKIHIQHIHSHSSFMILAQICSSFSLFISPTGHIDLR